MARNSLNAPAHRVARRVPIANGGYDPTLSPSGDAGGAFVQDIRLPFNTMNSASGAQILGWYDSAPLIDAVPSVLAAANIVAAAVPVAGTAMTKVSATGAGITIGATAVTMLPAGLLYPVGTLWIDGQPSYLRFGMNDFTVLFDPTKMLARNLRITSVGNDSAATMLLVGIDVYGYLIHETVTLANAGIAATKKAYKGLISATPAGTLSGSNVSIGTGDVYGLPFYTPRASLISGFWNSLILTGTGTFVAGDTTAVSATTGDPRGTYVPGSASDGTKRLTLMGSPDPASMASLGLTIGVTGLPQF